MELSEAKRRVYTTSARRRALRGDGQDDPALRVARAAEGGAPDGAGYRIYADTDVHTLRFIRRARDLGFSMKEIRAVARALAQPPARERGRASHRAAAHAPSSTGKIRELQEMRGTLEHLVHHCHGDSRPDCPILDDLSGSRPASALDESGPSAQRKPGKLLTMAASPQLVTDPVCGMQIDPATAAGHSDSQGHALLLLQSRMSAKFKTDPRSICNRRRTRRRAWTSRTADSHRPTPARCIPRSSATARARARSAAWRSSRATVTLDDGPNPELVDMTRRFWIGAAARRCRSSSLDDGRHGARADRAGASTLARRRTGSTSRCATPVVLWAGWPFFERGWASIVNRSPNMFTLIALGVGAAYVYSVVGDARARAVSRRLPDARRRRDLLRDGGR